jgi:pyruvate/2-oxoacid:ferredoxin oxidoreductase alpha subunit
MNAVKLARGIKDDRISTKFKFVKNIFSKGVPAAIQTDYSHLKVGLIKINTVWPFPEEELARRARDVNLVIVPEMNIGKYYREIQRALPGKKVISLPKCGGNLHTPNEILDEIINETLRGGKE